MVAGLEDAEQVTMSHLLSAGLPPTKPEPEPHGFFWHHRRAVVLTIGVSVLAWTKRLGCVPNVVGLVEVNFRI